MRLGLIGTGKQGQRYLLEKNGGRHIKVSGSRRIPLDDVDGVIIATHPAGHKELALECIAAGKAVLIEKPLALNLKDCEEILDAAEKADVRLMVAHTYVWDMPNYHHVSDPHCVIRYTKHDRDYSPWLDWAPHGLALLQQAGACERERLALYQDEEKSICLFRDNDYELYRAPRRGKTDATPMWHMVRDFVTNSYERQAEDDLRDLYTELFAED